MAYNKWKTKHINKWDICKSHCRGNRMTALEVTKYLLPRWLSGKKSACQCRRCKRCKFDPWVGKIPWRRKWPLAPVFLPGESHAQRSLVGYSPRGCTESDATEATKHTFIYLLFIVKSWQLHRKLPNSIEWACEPFTHFPLMVTSYTTVIRYQNQETAMGTCTYGIVPRLLLSMGRVV